MVNGTDDGSVLRRRRRSMVCQNQNSKQRVPLSSNKIMPDVGSYLNGHVC